MCRLALLWLCRWLLLSRLPLRSAESLHHHHHHLLLFLVPVLALVLALVLVPLRPCPRPCVAIFVIIVVIFIIVVVVIVVVAIIVGKSLLSPQPWSFPLPFGLKTSAFVHRSWPRLGCRGARAPFGDSPFDSSPRESFASAAHGDGARGSEAAAHGDGARKRRSEPEVWAADILVGDGRRAASGSARAVLPDGGEVRYAPGRIVGHVRRGRPFCVSRRR